MDLGNGYDQAARTPSAEHQASSDPEILRKIYESKLAMLKAVKSTLITNSDIVITIPQLTEAIDKLNEYLGRISKTPPETKENFIKIIARVSSALRNLAVMVENSDLLDETADKDVNLRELDELDLLRKGKRVYDYANMYMNSLCSFGVMEHVLIEFENKMEDFSCTVASKESQYMGDSLILEEQERLYNGALTHVSETVDRLVEELREAYPRFYNEYRTSRVIRNEEENKKKWIF